MADFARRTGKKKHGASKAAANDFNLGERSIYNKLHPETTSARPRGNTGAPAALRQIGRTMLSR